MKVKPGFRVVKALIQDLGLVINATWGYCLALGRHLRLEWLFWSLEHFFALRGWAQMPQKAAR